MKSLWMHAQSDFPAAPQRELVRVRVAITGCCMIVAFLNTAAADPIDNAEAALASGDYETAIRVIEPSVDAGNPYAQYYLGVMYNNGWGVPVNRARAQELFIAAKDHVPEARFNLGVLLTLGDGGSFEPRAGYRLIESAANDGLEPAVVEVARHKLGGAVTGYDPTGAFDLLSGLSNPNPKAVGLLAWMRLNGVGTTTDTDSGLAMLRAAVAAGDAFAQSVLTELKAAQFE